MVSNNNLFFLKEKRIKLRNAFVSIGILGLIVLIVDFRSPIFHESGLIFWNVNTFGIITVSGITALTCILWGYSNYQMKRFIEPYNRDIHLKLNIFAIDGIMWAVAVVVYTVFNSVFTAILAFILMILSLFSTALILSISKYLKADRVAP